ncbi:MAG TPA: M14 metallopeptidase family protein, partial [Blastocatellia bacterium]|nr:M14 metallopeptidase family protein [Blastocatellia bacterium]
MHRRFGIQIIALSLVVSALTCFPFQASAVADLATPQQFLGFRVGEDKKLARWDKIVEYMRLIANGGDRVRLRELGKSTNNNPFIVLEISSPDTLKNLDRFKQLERKLYFQGGAPTETERDEIFRSGKAVVLVTCNVHATEIGASQMVLELVHRLATENSPEVKKILDNVIFLLVPSLNPDGQIMVTDWYNKNVGTEYEASPLPWLYHPYIGHDNNRDMYMFTQKESQLTARLLWHDWFPSVWLDEHQMGSQGARIFVMPATDPINQNVHPLIYRWNGMLGQSQAAALEAAGKEGIIYNSTYTNFWQGAMAWSGWWHNQVGLLTEVASARIASPIEQRKAQSGQQQTAAATDDFQGQQRRQMENPNEPLPPPRDVTPRTEYPRPWLGGKWTLRDIVDYELIATMALLDTAADHREQLLRQIYEVNRATVEAGTKGDLSAIIISVEKQHVPREAYHLVERLQMAGVEVSRAEADFEADGKKYSAGTFVIPMNQVFARYAKDLLEKQTYPEVRRSPTSAPEPPYDVTAWSLGMQMGVETAFLKKPLPVTAKLTRLDASPKPTGEVRGEGARFSFDYAGPDSSTAVNRLLKGGVQTEIVLLSANERPRVAGTGASREMLQSLSRDLGLVIQTAASANGKSGRATATTDKVMAVSTLRVRAPRLGLYQPWTSNMDEGWTRWVLEQYEFPYKTLHNADIKAGRLREKFDAILLPDQQPRDILNG